ncbi:hypothetical protein F8388_010148 [Cannabis sativa]|uniref:Uncharacterized protein n=1 Tax=Cannabis sativa TaxID=3483 RepID=A0A7J6GRP5_CANSA|nr:hypothetical protein F8388_010148 [Cannabis sativa]
MFHMSLGWAGHGSKWLRPGGAGSPEVEYGDTVDQNKDDVMADLNEIAVIGNQGKVYGGIGGSNQGIDFNSATNRDPNLNTAGGFKDDSQLHKSTIGEGERVDAHHEEVLFMDTKRRRPNGEIDNAEINLAKKIIRMISTRKQRVMVVPCPAQGHVKPLVLFSHKLAQHGFRITFVYTDFDHNRISTAMKDDEDDDDGDNNIEFVSIPDGLRPEDDRGDLGNLCKANLETIPAELEKLITTINGSSNNYENNISCLVSDVYLGCAMEVATKLGIKGAVFCPSSAALLVHARYIPNMVSQGIMDESDGTSIHKQIIQLSPNMPSINTEKFPWTIDGSTKQKRLFQVYFKACQASEIAEWCLCNTTYDIESSALSLNPKFLSIGPLMANQANNSSDIPGSQFWAEDSSCLNWLDQQKPCSVIYIAFGSLTIHDNTQILELARGLELIGKPFLWVVRPGFVSGDLEHEFDPLRILGNNNFGKLVSWAPQQKVLSHPSIACFVSHCGWNSTIEGLSNGVPFLCWPYFGDQFLDKAYICDVWKVGIELEPSESGIILSQEIEIKVNKLLGDEEIRKKSIQLKEMILKNIAKDGQSSKNLDKFIKCG